MDEKILHILHYVRQFKQIKNMGRLRSSVTFRQRLKYIQTNRIKDFLEKPAIFCSRRLSRSSAFLPKILQKINYFEIIKSI